MKNFKVIAVLIPIAVVALFIYFTSISYSEPTVKNTLKNKSGNTATFVLQIYGDKECNVERFEYCINGGMVQTLGEDNLIEVPCDSYVTVCVRSATGCCGSWSGYIDPCEAIPFFMIPVTVSSRTPCCECFQ